MNVFFALWLCLCTTPTNTVPDSNEDTCGVSVDENSSHGHSKLPHIIVIVADDLGWVGPCVVRVASFKNNAMENHFKLSTLEGE